MGKCSIIFSRDDFKDETGCLKESGHFDHHICKTNKGTFMAWDYDWNCHCPDCKTDSFEDMCRIYWEVKTIKD